jgi:hypothetical protein
MEKDEKPSAPPPCKDPVTTDSHIDLAEKKMDDLLTRARQTVKPIITREAAGEVVSDDILNFRMKTAT